MTEPNRSLLTLTGLSPWNWLCIAGLVGLSAVDLWRSVPLDGALGWLRGVLPNFLATPILTFAVMAFRHPRRLAPDAAASQTRTFRWALPTVTVGLIACEFVQRTGGSLIFDPWDIAATLAGGATSVALFIALLAREPAV